MNDMSTLNQLGTFQRRGEILDVRFERHYPRPPETVWAALTEPERLADWMGVARLEPRVGGSIELMLGQARPTTGEIRIWEPPKVLEFTWNSADLSDSVVRYELTRDGAGTRLVFTHQGMPHVICGMMLPGWHYLLTCLGSLLEGAAKGESKQSWRELQTIYVGHYNLQGVMLDHPPAANEVCNVAKPNAR